MKIALVSPYDFAYPGGVTNHISALYRHLTQMGHDVRVIAPASKVVPDFGDRFIPLGKPRPIPASGTITRITISLRLAARIKAVLEQEKFDVIHLHEPFMPMLCTAILRFSQTTNIGTFHAWDGKPGYKFGRPISTIMLNRRVRKLHGRIAVSKPAMEFAHKYIQGHYDIIPNGIDLEHFSPDVPAIEELRDGKLNILFVGRLEYRKGLKYLINAFKQIKGELPNTRLIIIGPGTSLRRKYERQVKHIKLEDVVFVGYVAYDELPRYYKSADIFCSPATGGESFGIVLLEAMAMGKPVIATNIEGYANIVDHGTDGLLVPPKDEPSLTQAIISLLSDESLRQRLGNNGILKAQNYSWKEISQKVLQYYLSVLGEPPWEKRLPEVVAKPASA